MLTRREFLKRGALFTGALTLGQYLDTDRFQVVWPDAELLGRNCAGGILNLRAKPSPNGQLLATIYEDSVFVWIREVIGDAGGLYSRKWVETPDGYVYSPGVQMVKNLPNPTIETLPFIGPNAGFWAEVTIPYVDLVQANPPPRSPWLSQAAHPRLYYSQVVWIDDLRKGSQGQMLYRVNERYGSYGDVFWATGEAFRPITVEEVSPINPDAQNKKIVVDVNHQTLVCYEGNQEVYYCQVSTGALYDRNGTRVEEWATPPGPHPISRKLVSIHMAGGGLDTGWDTPGIGWTSLFSEGAAIHSTFWHNAFGTPKSHGCVNCKPEDSKWIFRWTMPIVTYEPGDITVQMPGGTVVDVVY